jgi:hypothetical protein
VKPDAASRLVPVTIRLPKIHLEELRQMKQEHRVRYNDLIRFAVREMLVQFREDPDTILRRMEG